MKAAAIISGAILEMGSDTGLGTDKTSAINEAVEANIMIYNMQNKVRLADRLQGADVFNS